MSQGRLPTSDSMLQWVPERAGVVQTRIQIRCWEHPSLWVRRPCPRFSEDTGRPGSGVARPPLAPVGPGPRPTPALPFRSHLYSAEESRPHRGGPGGPPTSLPQSDKFLIGHTFSRAATTATTTTATCSTVGPAHWPRVSTRPRPRHPAASSYWLAGPGPLPQSWAPGVSGADWPKAGARRGLEAG